MSNFSAVLFKKTKNFEAHKESHGEGFYVYRIVPDHILTFTEFFCHEHSLNEFFKENGEVLEDEANRERN